MQNQAAVELYDLLVTRDLDPKPLSGSTGLPPLDDEGKIKIADADMFSFDWKTENQNYGTVVILLSDKTNNMEVYFGDNVGRSMEKDDKADWYSFLEQLKNFSVRNNFNGFSLENLNRLKYTMQGIAAIKEGLFEGYYGRRRTSYHGKPQQTRLMIKHNRDLAEGEPRYRSIESLYVETADDQRFKLPFKNLKSAQAMATHVSEGGTPYDAFGQHIIEITNEINTMGRFLRAVKNKQYDEDTASLIEATVKHYQALKDKIKKIISRRGYREERELYDPAHISDSAATAESLRARFVEEVLDQRIEAALPVLEKIKGQMPMMKEVNQFESWANQITEGTWALPDTPEQMKLLRKLMSKPLTVGPDALNATESLYDIVGDDQLYDIFDRLAEEDPDIDIWQNKDVMQRLLKLVPNLKNADVDDEVPDEPIAKAGVDEELDTDGVMMTRPSNMSSESIDRFKRLAGLVI